MGKKVVISVGHSILKNGMCTSAEGEVNEYRYNKKLAPELKKYLEKAGWNVTVIVCPEKRFQSKAEEKSYKLPLINKGNYDLAIELHLNASDGKGHGTEVYYTSSAGKKYAQAVQKKLSTLFKDREIKKGEKLYFLNGTKPPAILIESFFCDNKEDYKKGKDVKKVAKLIAEGITGKSGSSKEEQKPPYMTVKKTSSEEAIMWIQRGLNKCYTGKLAKLKVDGKWGTKTQKMLEAYHKQLGWKIGTYAGEKTCKALHKNRKK